MPSETTIKMRTFPIGNGQASNSMTRAAKSSAAENLLIFRRSGDEMVIPASLTVLATDLFVHAKNVVRAKFESGSQVRRIGAGTFGLCGSLKSICIAASVEVLARQCFTRSPGAFSNLQKVTFEPGSKLREIEPGAFGGCIALDTIFIPASVSTMTGASLAPGFCHIELEPGNPHFEVKADFLIDRRSNCILRYVGSEVEAIVPDEIEQIDEGCFRSDETLDWVGFGPNSKLSSIGAEAYADCDQIRKITIPASVASIGAGCFRDCSFLRRVSFSLPSVLDRLPDQTFCGCVCLKSIILPATVKVIGARCFDLCQNLENSPLPADSGVVRIGQQAFSNCHFLSSLFLPSSVEFVGEHCFDGCGSLSKLTFASPSHLRELLDLPARLSGLVAIPDSVEILRIYKRWEDRFRDTVLTFGAELRLTQFRVVSEDSLPCRLLVRVSARSLKLFRINLEFETDT
jgi:hypothetical protein